MSNLKSRTIVFLLLFVRLGLYATDNNVGRLDSIRITYGYLDGYGLYRATSTYTYNNNVFILQKDKTQNEMDGHQVPDTIYSESVYKLWGDCRQCTQDDFCDCLEITVEDYDHLITVLNDSLPYYFPYLQSFSKNDYELRKEAFLELDCNEIIKMLECPHEFSALIPLLKIEMYVSGKIISIRPVSYFKGTAWEVLSNKTRTYLEYNNVLSFLRETHYDNFVCFYERFFLLFQLADNMRRRTPHMRKKALR